MSDESMSQEEQEQIAQAVAQIREQWSGVVNAVVATCEGDTSAAAQLNPFLDQMAQNKDWSNLVGVLRRILAGERDPMTLLQNADDTDMLIVSDILRDLGVDPRSLPMLPGEELEGDDDGEMVSLEEFLNMVVVASKPGAPAEMNAQLQQATQGMATQAGSPPEVQELGRVLNRILAGERNPDLGALHPQLVERVRGMLVEIGT